MGRYRVTPPLFIAYFHFVHLEEHWNRSYDDNKTLELERENITFSPDGMQIIA
jgi:hypothetical protein